MPENNSTGWTVFAYFIGVCVGVFLHAQIFSSRDARKIQNRYDFREILDDEHITTSRGRRLYLDIAKEEEVTKEENK